MGTSWNKGLPWSEEVKAKLRAVSISREQFMGLRGGNGTGMARCEALLKSVLPDRFITNYPVALGRRRAGYPTSYKVDFGDPSQKVAIEVDGSSHNRLDRQAQDWKKEEALAQLGWKVFRITNAEVERMFGIYKSRARRATLPKTP